MQSWKLVQREQLCEEVFLETIFQHVLFSCIWQTFVSLTYICGLSGPPSKSSEFDYNKHRLDPQFFLSEKNYYDQTNKGLKQKSSMCCLQTIQSRTKKTPTNPQHKTKQSNCPFFESLNCLYRFDSKLRQKQT